MTEIPQLRPLVTSADDFVPREPLPSITGKGWTGVTLRSFDQFFQKLPAELRLRVWSFCVLEPRVLELEPNPRCDQIITRHKPPAYLQACHEARFEGLKVYEVLGNAPNYSYSRPGKWTADENEPRCARILINFQVDTIIFTAKMFINPNAIPLVAKGMLVKYEKLLNLGIHYSGCQLPNPLNEETLKCSALQNLYLVFDDHREGRLEGFDEHPDEPEMQAKEILVAGNNCAAYTVPKWSHMGMLPMFRNFVLLAHAEVIKFEELYQGEFLLDQYNRLETPTREHPDEELEDTDVEGDVDDTHYTSATFDFRELVQSINLIKSKILQFEEDIGSPDDDEPPEDVMQELFRREEEIEQDHKTMIVSLRRLLTILEDAKFRLRNCTVSKQEQRDSERVHRLRDYVDRYRYRRVQYRQRREPNLRYSRSTTWYDFEATEPLSDTGPWYARWVERVKRQQRKKADRHGEAKLRIFSRKGLGSPFGFRMMWMADGRCLCRYCISRDTKPQKSGKKKLKGKIMARKAKPALVRDGCIYKE